MGGVANQFGNIQTIVREKTPIIVSGTWYDKSRNRIEKADLGEEVVFNLFVQNVNVGEVVELFLFEKNTIKNKDLNKKYDCTIGRGGFGNVTVKLDKAWSSYLDEIGEGDELEIFFRAKYNGREKNLTVLEVYDTRLITVLIELKKEVGGEKTNVGHSGIIINDDYYDYGPQGGEMFYTDGEPWWDSAPVLKDEPDGSVSDINPNKDLNRSHMDAILNSNKCRKRMGITSKVVLIDIYITKSENDKIEKWWKDKYDSLGKYSIVPVFGSQCTTTVRQSIEESTNVLKWVNTGFTQSPDGLMKLLTEDGKHTSGIKKDKKLVITKNYPELV